MKKVLGLDLGSNSIGFSLLELENKDEQIIFNEIVSNSIVFSEPNSAEDRRSARGDRRRNERKSARKKFVRKLFVKYEIANNEFIENPTKYLNSLTIKDNDVYSLRQKAIDENLSKEEFIYAVYSITTNRGYNNMFSTSNEDGAILEPIAKNKKEYIENSYKLPSKVLTKRRDALEDVYQNYPIRNKKSDYSNSLDRDLHKEELIQVVSSQNQNRNIFSSEEECKIFLDELLDKNIINTPFYQRTLKSFEGMVAYCSFYDEFNPKGSYKRAPLANVRNIELTLRQTIDNYKENIINKNGEIKNFTKEEINNVVEFWVNTPNVDKITNKNIFKNVGFKDIKIHTKDDKDLLVIDIKSHRNMLEIFFKYEIDFNVTQNYFYNEVLLKLHYFKNESSRVEHIEKLIKKYDLSLDRNFAKELATLDGIDGFGSLSLEFINEVLEVIKKEDKTHYEALESLGYFSKYIDMPTYDYLPPLEPTKADIKWLQENLPYFETKHLFYQPMIAPKVKRVIGVLRKLINEIIKRYGKIDEIRIETSKEMNTKKEKEKIDKNQLKDKSNNDNAVKFLKNKGYKESIKNIEKVKLWKEQGGFCLYSEEEITEDELIDEMEVEVEHFIPRSVIWINSYKNKILVKKKYNQNKGSQHPIEYLKSIGQWENFKGRVQSKFMDFKEKDWLTKEDIINSVMKKEHWQDSFLNDTRSATRTIQKYLNHYLYPNQKEHNKDGERHIFSVSAKAVSELKYMWGIHEVMPKNEDGKKDRDTNYHHTLDAFAVALCSNTAINTLHSYFKKKENRFKTKALKDKLTSNIPISKDGINIVEYLKLLVKKYEDNRLYVCPYNKRKTNMKGFKDGNLKLYIAKDPKDDTKDILAEMEKVAIDQSLLIKKVNGFDKERNDKEVLKEIESIQNRLNPVKQKKIIEALKIYGDELLRLRNELKQVQKDIKPLDEKKKVSKSKQEENIELDKQIEELKLKKQNLSKEMEQLKCSFPIKNGKRQIVNSLNLYKTKIEQSKSDAIIFPKKEKNKIERLNIKNYENAINFKEPFLIKMNESTLNVQLFNTEKRGQAIGLNYFGSIANNIKTKINQKFEDELKSKKADLTLYKNDLVKVVDEKENKIEFYIFNGGGNIAGSNNKLELKGINQSLDKRLFKTLNKTTIVSRIGIDFFGNIKEV
jgi:CRISPR-associated endonuclease Csn1